MNCPSLALVCNPVSGRALSNMQMAPSSVGSALLPFFFFFKFFFLFCSLRLRTRHSCVLQSERLVPVKDSQGEPSQQTFTPHTPVHPTLISTSLFLFLDFNRVALGRVDGLSSHCWCPYVTKNGGKSCLCVCRTSVCR